MNLFNYVFYRSYNVFKKYKEPALFRSIIYMQFGICQLLLCPFNAFVSSLFRGGNQTPLTLVSVLLISVETYYVGKYYKRNGKKILKEYERLDTSKYDRFFPMLVTCILIPFALTVWMVVMLYVVFKILFPFLNIEGCLYPYVEFIEINLNL